MTRTSRDGQAPSWRAQAAAEAAARPSAPRKNVLRSVPGTRYPVPGLRWSCLVRGTRTTLRAAERVEPRLGALGKQRQVRRGVKQTEAIVRESAERLRRCDRTTAVLAVARGRIAHVFEKVNATGHAAEVAAALEG